MGAPKLLLFRIVDNKRVANSGVFIEGTDIQFDFHHEFPIPNETTILEKGTKGEIKPRIIRYIPSASSIYKDEQLKNGFGEKYRLKNHEKPLLTFVEGKLAVPETDKNRIDFLKKAGWYDGLESNLRMQGVSPLYAEVDVEKEVQEQVHFEDLVTEARAIVKNLNIEEAKDILRLHNPLTRFSSQITLGNLKLRLNSLAQENPEFILNAFKSKDEDIAVVLNKAVEYNIVDLKATGKLRIKHPNKDEYESVADLTDVGGPSRKFERAVDFLKSSKGKQFASEIQRQVDLLEEKMISENGEGGGEKQP